VDQDDADRRGQRGQCPAYRVAAGGPTLDHLHRRARVVAEEPLHGLDLALGRSDHHELDAAGRQSPHGVREHRLAGQGEQRLRRTGTEPLAPARGRHDRGHRRLGPGHNGSEAGLANTIRPFAVVSTLVTRTEDSAPIPARDRSATTIVPSSR
jgi:hypothetical protein